MSEIVIDSSNYRRAILFLLLPVLWLIPGIILAISRFSSPFSLLDFSSAQMGIISGSIGVGSGAGYESFVSSANLVGGASIPLLLYLPIGSFVVPLVYFLAAKRLSTWRYAAVVSVFIAFVSPLVTVQFGLFIFTMASTIALVFILALTSYLKSRNAGLGLAIMLLIVAGAFIYRPLAAWLAIALVTSSIGGRVIRGRRVEISPMMDLAIFSLLVYMLSEFHLYETLLPAAASESIVAPTGDIQYIIGNFFWGRNDIAADPLRIENPQGAIVGVSTAIAFFALLILIIYALMVARKRIGTKGKETGFSVNFLVMIAVLSMFVGNIAISYIYYRGGIDIYPVLLLFPLVLPIAVSIVKRVPLRSAMKDAVTFIVPILIVAMIGFASLQMDGASPSVTRSTDNLANFWSDSSSDGSTMMASYGSFGVFSLSLSEMNVTSPPLIGINASGYNSILGSFNSTSVPSSSLLLSKGDLTSPILGNDWLYYQPVSSSALKKIESNYNMTLAYDDGSNHLFFRH